MKRDYFWNTLGAILQSAISPLLLLVVTRLNGVAAAGVFSFAFAVSLLLWALGMWGGRTYQVSDTRKEFAHQSYIMVRIVLAVIVLTVAAIFCVLNQYDAYKTGLIFALVIFKLLESFADVLYGILQVHGKLYMSGRSLTAKAVLGFAVFVGIDMATGNLILASLGIVLVNILIFALYDVVRTRQQEEIFFPLATAQKYLAQARQILWRCAGVFVIFFAAMFSLNIPRYFIDMRSDDEVGYFGIIAMPITLIVLLISFILQPNIVRLSELYKKADFAKFKRSVNKILLVSVGIGVGVLLVTAAYGAQILQLIFGISFVDYYASLVVIVAGGVASALVTVYLNAFVIMRRIKFAVIVLTVTNILLVPLSYFMVRDGGVLGGVWAFTGVNIVQLMMIAVFFWRSKRGGVVSAK